jgi:methionine synthase II (cobalamin-independent)
VQNPFLFEPCCLATTIGSLPHTDAVRGTALTLAATPQIPSWAQFPKRIFLENMMVQFIEGLPGLLRDGDRFYIDPTAPDFVDQMTEFYTHYLAAVEQSDPEALEYFKISSDSAAGFGEYLTQVAQESVSRSLIMLKGQVTGPFTQGINLTDKNQRPAYYDEQLRDVIVKLVTLKALWQIKHLKTLGRPILIFLDEPSLLGFGSQTYITVSREDIIHDINEVAASVHNQGARTGVHCEENTDWSLLMQTELDILDFDAYDHLQSITLYPAELKIFLEHGGCLGWGLVPTLDKEAAATETLESLLDRFEKGVETLVRKGFAKELLLRRALITPSCGMGGVLTEPLAERVLNLLSQVSAALRESYGFR